MNMKRDFYLDVYTIYLINNIHHMRFSGTEPISVILRQSWKVEKWCSKMPK